MGPSETTRTDPDTSAPRPWVEIVSTPSGSISVRTVRAPGTVKLSRICAFCGRILLDQRLIINDLAVAAGGENAAKLLNLTAPFPERGMRRDDLFPGLRVVGFERRVTLAFHVGADTVTFLRILYGGRDIDALMMS